jgi:catalase
MTEPAHTAFKLGARSIGALAVIALVIGAGAAAFAYTAGWLSPDRLTPEKMVDALSRRGGDPLGHRRNHAKGICFTGESRRTAPVRVFPPRRCSRPGVTR